jgi:hypothetical protein
MMKEATTVLENIFKRMHKDKKAPQAYPLQKPVQNQHEQQRSPVQRVS